MPDLNEEDDVNKNENQMKVDTMLVDKDQINVYFSESGRRYGPFLMNEQLSNREIRANLCRLTNCKVSDIKHIDVYFGGDGNNSGGLDERGVAGGYGCDGGFGGLSGCGDEGDDNEAKQNWI